MRVEVAGNPVFVATGSRPHSAESASTLVFLHGAGMDHTVWVMPARHFARKGFRVIAPDLPGHGRSGGAPLASVTAMADWVAQLLLALNVEQTAVLGHSMGSLIAYAFASRHAARCRQLVLLGTSFPMPVSDALLSAAADNDHAAIEMANTWSHSRRGRLGGNDNPGMWMFAGGERLIERSRPGVFHTDLDACNGFAAASLEAVVCPTLVIAGAADQMTPVPRGRAVLEALLAAGAQAELVELPGSGHSMLAEQPNSVLDALIDFIDN